MKGMQSGLQRMLRLLRAERGLTLEEAARRTGVTRETLGLLERGKRHPHTPTLSKIASGYGVSLEALLDLEEDEYQDEEEASLASLGKAEAPEEEAGPFKMPVERRSPEPSTRKERIESLRDATQECLDMTAAALREFEVLKQTGTKRQLEILGSRALCTYLGAAYLTNLALDVSKRQGMPKDDEERKARQDAVRAVNKLGDAAGEIMEAARTSGTLIGMREFQLRRGTG